MAWQTMWITVCLALPGLSEEENEFTPVYVDTRGTYRNGRGRRNIKFIEISRVTVLLVATVCCFVVIGEAVEETVKQEKKSAISIAIARLQIKALQNQIKFQTKRSIMLT